MTVIFGGWIGHFWGVPGVAAGVLDGSWTEFLSYDSDEFESDWEVLA